MMWVRNGNKNDTNGIFWLKKNGTGFIKGDFFQGQIIESKMGTYSGGSIPATATASTHSSAGKPVELDGKVSVNFRTNGNTASQSAFMRLNIRRNGATIGSATFTATGFYEAEDAQTLYTGFLQTAVVDTLTTAGGRSYSVQVERLGGVTPSSNVSVNLTIKTYENKLG